MARPEQLTDLQIDVAAIFFSLDVATDFLVAGGAALIASDLINRPTEDLDLFAGTATTSVAQAKDDFVQAVTKRGCGTVLIEDSATIRRFDDREIPLPEPEVPTARTFFMHWADTVG